MPAAQQAKKEERPLRVPCSRAGGRSRLRASRSPRCRAHGVSCSGAVGRARALGYLHGWREAVRRSTSQIRRAPELRAGVSRARSSCSPADLEVHPR